MTAREEKIVDAAVEVFSRYGVKRTTMNDIAGEAGVSRQTLYNAYANKDEVLQAAIRIHAERSLAAIERRCAEVDDLSDQLDIVFQYLIVKPFEQLSALPHADELITGFNQAAKQEIDTSHEQYRAFIETLLQPYEERIRAGGLTPKLLSDCIQKACVGFKYKARNKKHVRELLGSLKALALSFANDNARGRRRRRSA